MSGIFTVWQVHSTLFLMSGWVIATPVELTIVLVFFIYGFLVLIALITLFNIINSIAMSVAAKMKQYEAFRAIGLSNRQLAKMIVAEASTYAITGIICGSVLGIVCNKILFSKLITYHWGDAWSVPLVELGIIIVVVAIAVILAVRNPIRKMKEISIVDTISVL